MQNKILILGLVSSLMSSTALAHTNSIGYVGDGNGGLNFWYGNWHGQAFNEAEIKIIHPDGTTSIDGFNLLSQNSPAGLLSGVNFFTSNGTQLVAYDPTGTSNGGTAQESYVWQGINYQNLAVGQYTFIYIPLGDVESSYPNLTPTADWMPMDNVIRTLSITLTQGDLNGDANQNGILDINEVAAGAASGAPTLVSSSAPYIDTNSYSSWSNWSVNTALAGSIVSTTAYTASDDNIIQTIDRETTTVITTPELRTRTYNTIQTDTYSDGSTQNTVLSSDTETATRNNVTTNVSNPGSLTGRVDQIATAQDVISSTIRNINFNNIQFIRMNSNYDNGMSGKSTGVVIGASKEFENNIKVQGGVVRLGTNLSGNKDMVHAKTTLFGASIEKYGLSFEIRHAMIDYDVKRTIGNFGNFGKTSGKDTNARIMYSLDIGKVQPVIGYTRGKRTINAYNELGSTHSARNVNGVNQSYGYATAGLRGDLGLFDFSALHHTDGVNEISLGLEKNADNIGVRFEAKRSITKQGSSNALSAGVAIKF